jgi:hypothetical protein
MSLDDAASEIARKSAEQNTLATFFNRRKTATASFLRLLVQIALALVSQILYI